MKKKMKFIKVTRWNNTIKENDEKWLKSMVIISGYLLIPSIYLAIRYDGGLGINVILALWVLMTFKLMLSGIETT